MTLESCVPRTCSSQLCGSPTSSPGINSNGNPPSASFILVGKTEVNRETNLCCWRTNKWGCLSRTMVTNTLTDSYSNGMQNSWQSLWSMLQRGLHCPAVLVKHGHSSERLVLRADVVEIIVTDKRRRPLDTIPCRRAISWRGLSKSSARR